MNTEAFIQWALADERTVEERYTTELIVEQGLNWWFSHHKISRKWDHEADRERKRQRALNPAYQPKFTATDVRRAAEQLPRMKSWWAYSSADERPIRDLTAFGFLTDLEDIKLSGSISDVSVFARLPNLRVLHFGSADCEDLSPIADCRHLRELGLTLSKSGYRTGSHWPNVAGLERLAELETLSLRGNLLAFAPGVVWPKVRRATLHCDPLAARSVRELPQLPACEFLTLAGVEKLDGIEAFPRLRNLTVTTDTRSFAPLEALTELTCFTCTGFEPLDVRPLTRLPKLQCVTFNANYQYVLTAPKPRDFSPFADAPMLRELHVENCPPVADEVRTMQALLLPWDDLLLAPAPRPVPEKLRMIIAPWNKSPRNRELQFEPGDNGLVDDGLRKAQGAWVGRYLTRAISDRLGCSDWGSAGGGGEHRSFSVTIELFAVVEKFAEIIEATRAAIARLRHDYEGDIMMFLKVRLPDPTPAQQELEEQFREEQEKAEWERSQRERQEHLERLHRFELKKQLGEKIKPEDFVAPPPTPLPAPPWERDDEEDDAGDGFIAVKEKVEPPPNLWDNDHPLADQYNLMAHLSLTEIWFYPHSRDLAIYLMHRQPDEEIPEDPKPE